MEHEDIKYIDQRLIKLEAIFDERWNIYTKHYDDTWQDQKVALKDLGLKIQVMQERFMSQHEICMNEIDDKMKELESEMNAKIDKSEKRTWTIASFILIGIPTLFFAIYQAAMLLISL